MDIGRPSTYASIIQVIRSRGYVIKNGKSFYLNDRGRVVNVFLVNYFKKFLEYKFTADMEQQLDDVAANKAEWKELVLNFWKDFQKFVFKFQKKYNSLEEFIERFKIFKDNCSKQIFQHERDNGPRTKGKTRSKSRKLFINQ